MMEHRPFSYLPPILAASLLMLFSAVCHADLLYVVNSQSRTLSRIDTATDAVNNSFSILGNVPNKIVVDEDYIWSVNSGDNAVQKISRSSGATISNIFLGPGCNPWDAIKHDNFLYVSGLFSGKVYKVDTLSGSVTANVNVGTAPEGLCIIGSKLFVANAGNYSQNYAGSSVSVIDLESFSVISTIPVSANPQYLASHNGLLHVSCTGNWTDISGSVCIIDPYTHSVIQSIPTGGTPGCLWMANSELTLVGDSNGAVLYSYNPSSFVLFHGAGNPISNGGSEVVGNSAFVAVLSPNWGNNGIVKLLQPDLSPLKQYSVALMPTDLKLYSQPSEASDIVAAANRMSVFPNPLRQGEKLQFKFSTPLQGKLVLYNQKGQVLLNQDYNGQELILNGLNLANGVYFFQVKHRESSKQIFSGKLVVLK